ncbi:PLP-dependent aminotransferase family protein [Vineibacter terrae]|uniref:PLP-dependent aminotransferase family protein n=2 Tax=Vineibacter terrae TaxID=2586908 RepID=A0A5C8P820_9HYPH|nr:PLP-dependent aminotransferase family protein [Vineibacter terrae]
MGDTYQAIADGMAADIASGRLRPGERLPPQRAFAYQRGIASSTAARVYTELRRRGLVAGEVGRGTFVRAVQTPPRMALVEPAGIAVDLELNFPTVAGQPALLARSLNGLIRRAGDLGASLQPVGASGTSAARQAAAAFLARGGWSPSAADILFAGNGKQAIAAVLAALVMPGERLGIEALTYPLVKSVAARLGIELVALGMDDDGVLPDAVMAAQRTAPMAAVYLQPTLHNPLGTTMPVHRRKALATVCRRHDLIVVEDAVYAFLIDGPPPLAAFAPERSVLIDSLSKRLSPGLTAGFVVVPAALSERVAASLRTGAWLVSGFALEASVRWMTDGTVQTIIDAKRHDAAARQAIARDKLAGLAVRCDPRSYHCWLVLPETWRADMFVSAAARRGIAITPASAFAVRAGHAPNACRLALASPAPIVLGEALAVIGSLARGDPQTWGTE